MKARTKLELQIVEQSNNLQRITEAQEKWAYKECLPHKGFANKSSAFCLDCGNTFSLSIISRKKATCPHCLTKLDITNTRSRTHKEINYFAIAHIIGEFQVIENFELIAYYKKGQPVKHFLHPILEYWLNAKGKMTMVGLNHNFNYYADSWGGNWEIRKESPYYWNNRKYHVYARKYHPDSKFKSGYLKYGINQKLSGISFLEAIKHVPKNSIYETLIKIGKYNLLSYLIDKSEYLKFWPSIKVMLRNKYQPKDLSIYFDYLNLIAHFQKDLHSPKYVCPKNLKLEHDRLVNKKRVLDKKMELERQRQQLEIDEVNYRNEKKAFLGLCFQQDNICIKMLETVKDFIKEGDIHKHCVYTNKYYKEKGSIIFSASVNGQPVETIEFSLSKMKVIQARGFQNKASEHNKEILKVLKYNIPKIRKIVKSNKKLERGKILQSQLQNAG